MFMLVLIFPNLQENNLRQSSYRERFFDLIKRADPFEPVIPRHLKRTSYFTAPFNYDKKDMYVKYQIYKEACRTK